MINISNKENCCGCTACYNICPKNAIEMKYDFEGFTYPVVNEAICVECGLCEKICPIQHKVEVDSFTRKSYVLRAKELEIVRNSTSGGFFSPVANWVLRNEGIVCAATYDDNFKVVHEFLYSGGGIPDQFRGSKYVQSELGDSFQIIKQKLNQGYMVCFVGTTCQVYGLKSYLHKDYSNLILIDLVCHGVPSGKLWEKYLQEQKSKYHSEIKDIVFRNKTYGYHSGTMKISFTNGMTYYGSARVDPMLKSFFKEISSRPSCYNCRFKTLERCSDFTIYDCWHASELVDGLIDDDKGYTNVIVQSEKGASILEQIKDNYEVYSVDTESAIAKDGVMVRKSAIPHKHRSEYYHNLSRTTLADQVQKYIPISRKDRIIEWSKKWVYRIGVYDILKKKHR